MTIQKRIRALAWLSCGALIVGGCALQASTLQSEKFEIPFEFHVQKKTLPSGQYQVRRDAASSPFVFLVNTRTGERVALLSPTYARDETKTRLIFENGQNGHTLKGIS
jgi:hypothetical protein